MLMRMVDIIEKKKYGNALSDEEIRFFVKGYTASEIPDYQTSALLMAIYFNGMDEREITTLTLAMAESGDMLDLSAIEGVKADKHSTGGVGDKISLILAPMIASLGVPMAKMSGRGLGHTGGTIDKLESIPGFTTALDTKDFVDQVNSIKIAIAGQTGNLAPADKKLYALRDVTGTVDSIPLIASSIMSKKLAAGADVIVLDVKCGDGAFMKKEEDALKLAKTMVSIGNLAGRKTVAVISDMDRVLGRCVGNSVEVMEAIDVLKGDYKGELLDLTLALGAKILLLTGRCKSEGDGLMLLRASIETGKAIEKFREWVKAQHGDARVADDKSLLPLGKCVGEVVASKDGYIKGFVSSDIGHAVMLLGGGRSVKEDVIDPGAGVILQKKEGDRVSKGDVIAVCYSSDEKKLCDGMAAMADAVLYTDSAVEIKDIVMGVVDGD